MEIGDPRAVQLLVYYATRAHRLDLLKKTLGSLYFVRARALGGVPALEELIRDYGETQTYLRLAKYSDIKEALTDAGESRQELLQWVRQFSVFVQMKSGRLAAYPDLTFQLALNEPDISAVHIAALQLVGSKLEPAAHLRWLNKPVEMRVLAEYGGNALSAPCFMRHHLHEKQLVMGIHAGSIRVMDYDTGETLAIIEDDAQHEGAISALSLSPAGTHVVTGGKDGRVLLWNLIDAAVEAELAPHSAEVTSVQVHGAGHFIVSVSADNRIHVLEDAGALEGERWHLLHDEQWSAMPPVSLSYSPDGKALAIGCDDGNIKVLDAAGHSLGLLELLTFRAHFGCVTQLEYSRDAKLLASGSEDRDVKVWSAGGYTMLGKAVSHASTVTALAFSPSGHRLASGGEDHTVYIVNCDTMTVELTLRNHSDTISALAWGDASKQLVTGSGDCTMKLWDVVVQDSADGGSGGHHATATLKGITTDITPTLGRHQGRVTSVQVSPDRTMLASGAEDQVVKLWSLQPRVREIRHLLGHAAAVSAVAWNPTQEMLASGSVDGTVVLWTGTQFTFPRAVRKPATDGSALSAVTCLTFSHNGEYLTAGCDDGQILVWTVRRRELLHVDLQHKHALLSLLFTAKCLTSIDRSGQVIVWHPTSFGQVTVSENSAGDTLNAAAFDEEALSVVVSSPKPMMECWKVVRSALFDSALDRAESTRALLTMGAGGPSSSGATGRFSSRRTGLHATKDLAALSELGGSFTAPRVGRRRQRRAAGMGGSPPPSVAGSIASLASGRGGRLSPMAEESDEDAADGSESDSMPLRRRSSVSLGHKKSMRVLALNRRPLLLDDFLKLKHSPDVIATSRPPRQLWPDCLTVLSEDSLAAGFESRVVRIFSVDKSDEVSKFVTSDSVAAITSWDSSFLAAGDAGGNIYALQLVERVSRRRSSADGKEAGSDDGAGSDSDDYSLDSDDEEVFVVPVQQMCHFLNGHSTRLYLLPVYESSVPDKFLSRALEMESRGVVWLLGRAPSPAAAKEDSSLQSLLLALQDGLLSELEERQMVILTDGVGNGMGGFVGSYLGTSSAAKLTAICAANRVNYPGNWLGSVLPDLDELDNRQSDAVLVETEEWPVAIRRSAGVVRYTAQCKASVVVAVGDATDSTLSLAIDSMAPILLIAGAGGLVDRLVGLLDGDDVKPALLERQKQLGEQLSALAARAGSGEGEADGDAAGASPTEDGIATGSDSGEESKGGGDGDATEEAPSSEADVLRSELTIVELALSLLMCQRLHFIPADVVSARAVAAKLDALLSIAPSTGLLGGAFGSATMGSTLLDLDDDDDDDDLDLHFDVAADGDDEMDDDDDDADDADGGDGGGSGEDDAKEEGKEDMFGKVEDVIEEEEEDEDV
eukprot:PLAT3678.5.p1 GENE.PLAT3678.5~~PLAT3678.5.p1  ORF type:complete len:1389 (+),score=780.41 PLAT3678.5:138-4304(+)